MRTNYFLFVSLFLYCFFISCSNTNKQYDSKSKLTGIHSQINSNGDSIVKDYLKFPNFIEERIFHKNGEFFQTIFLDSVEYGISRHFYKDKLIRKGLFYYGDLIAYEFYNYDLPPYMKINSEGSRDEILETEIIQSDIYSCNVTQYRKGGNSEKYISIGNYFVKTENDSIDDNYSDYFIADVQDTITSRDSVIINIVGNLSFTTELNYRLSIGSVDSFSVLSNNTDDRILNFNAQGDKKIVLPPQKPGYHFIVGTVFIDIDNRKQQYVVFDDFIVK